MIDERQARATARMALRLPEDIKLEEGWSNDDPNMLGDFPRMLYRKTAEEQRDIQTDEHAKCGKTWLVTNKYDGFLCDTRVVEDIDEMEQAIGEGWEISPKAAHGISDGAKVAVSAKDARIADLEEQLAAAQKRGPGRPPKQVDTPDTVMVSEA